uniref:CBS domain-containing protein n=1 Tax=Ditylenchus dipsaci TaxID=166011 RepID=A0A915D7P6_9BILA
MRKDVVALEPIESVGRIVEILRSTKHHGFPVVDQIDAPTTEAHYPNYGHLKGLILRSQLIVLLKKRHFSVDYEGRTPAPGAQSVSLKDFRQDYPRYEGPIAELGLSKEDEKVPLNVSLDSIFRLFRGLGLRFLFVVNDENKLRGIITRKDIARFKERRVKKKYLVHEFHPQNVASKAQFFDLDFVLGSTIALSDWSIPLEYSVEDLNSNPLEAFKSANDGWQLQWRVTSPPKNLETSLKSALQQSTSIPKSLLIRLEAENWRVVTSHAYFCCPTCHMSNLYDISQAEAAAKCEQESSAAPMRLSVHVTVNSIGELPGPDTASYLQRIEMKKV